MIRALRGLGTLALAIGLALMVLARLRRGEVVVLSAPAAPAIRLAALLIVFAQGCADRLRGKDEGGAAQARPGAAPAGEDFSEEPGPNGHVPGDRVDAGDAFPALTQADLGTYFALQRGSSGYRRLVLRLAPLSGGTGPDDPVWSELAELAGALERDAAAGGAFAAAVRAHLERRRQGQADTREQLLALLDAAEALPLYDPWLAAYLWRRAAALPGATAEARAGALARIERHLRVHHALLKGQAETGAVEFSAWRSKAAPPAGWTGVAVPPGLLAAARGAYPTTDAGTWETAGTVALTVVRGDGLALLRRGQATSLAPGATVTLRRLDVLQARGPAALRHPALGELSLGAGAVVTAWDLGERLGPAARAQVQAWTDAALAGDDAAARALEDVMPAAHAAIRAALSRKPGAPGAARLRMLLALFDE